MYWIPARHVEGMNPPTGTLTSPVRLDVYCTLNLTETEELRKLLASDDGKSRQDNFFLSEDTATPFKRGRILTKNGKIFKLSNASMYGK